MTAASALPFPTADGELGRLIGAHDWAAGPLGPPSGWAGPVRAAAAVVLESPQPMLLWIGPELVALYNDAFAGLAGRAHPAALGRPGARGFAEAWPVVGPVLEQVLETGTGVSVDDQPLVLVRGESAEETYWDLRHSPVRGDGGEVLAVLTITTETTARVIGERRRGTLRALGDLSPVRIAPAGHAVEHVTVAALDVLARNALDIPFAAVCRPARTDPQELEVAAAYGLPDGLPPLPATDGRPSAPELAWRTGERLVVRGLRERAPGALPAAHELGPLTPDAAVVVPLGAGAPGGALVLGTNPYRPLDDDQLAFLAAVENHVSTVLSDAGALDDVLDTARRDGRATSDDALSSALFQERERYRTLVTQAPVGIWVADRRGTTTFVNDQIAQLWGRPAAELTGAGWADQVHPDDREAAAAGWAAAVRHGTVWDSTYRIVAADGTVREVRTSARPLRDPAGAVTGFLATTADITEERRAEQIRRDVATEHAARRASEVAAARLRAMVQGLAAIVWEADWRPGDGTNATGLRFTFVSDRAEELLGHPAARWCDDPGFWPAMIHPEDREEALAFTGDRTAAGVDHDLTYRAVAIDGRVLWLHQVVHVVTGPDGEPVGAQGLTVDVTEQKRAERSAALLAESGRLVTQDGSVEDRLGDLARLVVHELGDAGVVALVGHDGLLHGAAVESGVRHVHPAIDRALRTPGIRLPAALAEALDPGGPVVVPLSEELLRVALADEDGATARVAHRARNALLVPLVVGTELAGVLAFVNFGAGRFYDDTELDLAAELGRRASMMLTSDRRRRRERRLQQVSSDLASAGSVLEAARLLVGRLPDFVGASAVSVYLAEPERGLRLVHAAGYDGGEPGASSPPLLDDPVPITAAVRTGEPVWIRTREEWTRDWPELVERASAAGLHAAAALPLAAVGRVVGAIGLSFPTERGFPAEERDFVLALVAQAAPAFERAAAADERRLIAETLQKSLLPPTLPHLDRILLASRYLAGARGSQAGGDWYDVLPLDEGRVAIAVGDVVGQGARAAAIMGQLRSALSGYLLEGHGPVQALERLDRFAGRVPGATGSTVACLVLDPGTGDLVWARAGHPPPLVAGPTGCRRLEEATGTVLGVRARPPFTAGTATLQPGESIVLYTDGLVERRGELVDDGIARLAGIAAERHGLAPHTLTDALLTGALAGSPTNDGLDPVDDVALIVARLVPPPLRLVLPAQAAVLRELRAAVLAWAEAAGVGEDEVYDLQLAVGEAAANAVEHAYRDREPGTMTVELEQSPDGGVEAHVRDRGSWRPVPEDKGYRGRGLELIRDVSSRMQLHHGPDGTDVRFRLPPSGAAPAADGHADARPAAPPPPPGPADVRVAGGTVEIRGELDLAGVRGVGEEVLASADAGGTLTVDLRPTTYLASAGVALLVEADRRVRAAGGRLRVRVRPNHVVRRALALSGVDGLIDVVESDDRSAGEP